jgi:hypothetical protein
MNLKWASDALDRLIEEANVCLRYLLFRASLIPLCLDQKSAGTLSDIPIDTRHISSKARKAKKGEHLRIRPGKRVTIHDFPRENGYQIQSPQIPPQPHLSRRTVTTTSYNPHSLFYRVMQT